MIAILQIVARTGVMRRGANGSRVKILQTALRRAGHELVVDGDFGSITHVAVERFQAAHGIAADGIVGPITAAYLDQIPDKPGISFSPLPTILTVAPWLTYMRALTGTREIPGARSNPLILSWVRSLGARYPALKPNIQWYQNDDVPWCGLGEAESVGNCDPGYMPPIAPLWADNWSRWGQELPFGVPGAIGIKPRAGGNHVTTYECEFDGIVWCRGANQNNMINVGQYKLKDFKTWRWPPGAILPPLKPLRKKFTGPTTSYVTES